MINWQQKFEVHYDATKSYTMMQIITWQQKNEPQVTNNQNFGNILSNFSCCFTKFLVLGTQKFTTKDVLCTNKATHLPQQKKEL